MPEVQEVFRMATQKVRPDPGFVDRQHDHRRRKDRNRRNGAFAVAAVIAVTAAVVIVTSQPRDATAPAGTPSTSPVELTALRSARSFADAIGATDVNAAFAYLAPDADISGLLFETPAGAEGIAEELRLQVSMLEAQGFRQTLGDCEPTGEIRSETTVRCAFDFDLLGSDELGLGPYAGSSYDFTVREGLITRASVSWDIGDFSPQVWEPFADWVSTNYPRDAAVMYQDETHSVQRLSVDSIRLWGLHVQDYVSAETPGQVRIAQRFMEARNTHDAEAILALLPQDGAIVRPMDDNLTFPDILGGRTKMDRARLALAFEAERLFQVQFGSVECRSEPSVHYRARPIVCTYVLDSRLRRIAGLDPAPKEMRIGVRDGLVTQLSFPYLGVTFPGYTPAEGGAFVEWLHGAHPDAGAPMETGTLFRYPGGQDMALILTPDAIQLLERYLGEYEAAVG